MTGAFLRPFTSPSRPDAITAVRGEGALIWDSDGNEYVDAMASLWYCNVGHGRPEIADAVRRQMGELEAFHCFDPFSNGPADELAARIADLSPIPEARVFFNSSGSEAVDTAMKLARLTHVLAGDPDRRVIISRDRGYHGTNYGGTSAQGLPPNKKGYGQLLPEVLQVAADDSEALSRAMRDHEGRVAAVITEPVQGAGGVFPPPPGYLDEARRLCDAHGALLIFDEVITGFGRLGSWFAADHYGVVPDLTTFAKAVTSGYLPLGGVIVGSRVRAALESDPSFVLRHGYTYSGHPTCCAAGLANLEIIDREGLVERASHVGDRLRTGLEAIAAEDGVAGIRAAGAVMAAALRPDQDAATIRNAMLGHGVVVRPIGADTIAYCPPLVITDRQIDQAVDALAAVVGP